MPQYSFFNTETEEYFEQWFDSYKEVEQWIQENKHINWLCGAPPQGDAIRMGVTKPDEGFRDLLKTIKKGNIRSDFNIR